MKDLYNFLTLIYKDDTEKKVEAENEDELQDTRNMDLLTKLNTRIGLEELCALSDCIWKKNLVIQSYNQSEKTSVISIT